MALPHLGYIRVSRVGDREETLISPELQANRIAQFAGARNLDVVMLEPELDVSGGKASRPILDAAILEVERRGAAGIIVAQLDRLSRMSLVDALKVIQRIEAMGGEVLAAGESFDATTPEGRMGRNVFLSMGEMQLERYKEQFRSAKERAVDKGIWLFPVIPRGYRKGKDRRLEPDPKMAPVVVKAFERRAKGAPWSEVADILGCGHTGARKAITNRVYCGELRLGDRINPTAHPALVPVRVFEAAQLRHPRPPRSGIQSLLAGIVRCAGCQRSMSPGTDGSGGRRIYRCFARNAEGRCQSPAIVGAKSLEQAVEAAVLPVFADVRVRAYEKTTEFEDAQRNVRETEAELRLYQDAMNVADVGAEHYGRGLKRRADAVDEARQQMGIAESRTRPIKGMERVLGEEWESLSVDDRRHVLRSSLGVVWVKKGRGAIRDRVRVIAIGFEPANLSGPGKQGSLLAPLEWPDGELDGEVPIPRTDQVT